MFCCWDLTNLAMLWITARTLFVLIGRVIKALHPEIKNVYLEHIEEAKKVLDYTL